MLLTRVIIALMDGGVWRAVTAQPQDSRDAGSSVASLSEKQDADEKEKETSSDEGTDVAGGGAESAGATWFQTDGAHLPIK